ncbi:exodeoxyribonuclease III [Thioflexithrix psekupsensis]|uniref:Exodeoxyribonuclease III n=1 Tax=Thioflexithrix psekupsensis TaxID=1570016 RepID=A0A251XC62_9GAMM|nr:exodeoxyribonuclease III [Thioflexithrix psekupsensis]OUD16244.1 exodeoxyribonuclease III [Thioflexithrix psekupsensis]
MRVITANVNGIRAAARKGFFTWLAAQNADVICIQETKAQADQLTDSLFHPQGYHCYYHSAEKKGYSGVALYSRVMPKNVEMGIGWPDIDAEGRYLAAHFEQVTIVSLYLHSGTSGEHRQQAKYAFMDRLLPYFAQHYHQDRAAILCGDWNIAHRPIDLKNWKNNQNHSGFLPEERAWLDRLFTETDLIDGFRLICPEPEHYTWWSNRGQAWAKNVGWRIDYQIITPHFKEKIQQAMIYKAARFSDHAPLMMDYDFILE